MTSSGNTSQEGNVPIRVSAVNDLFAWRYLAAWAIFYVAFGAVNVVFNQYWNWHENLALVLFLATIIVGFYWLIRGWKWKALSIFSALPILWVCDFALTSIGADVVQRSFWLTYPYYASHIQTGRREPFKWAESGWFLGGGTVNTLWHEPDATVWDRYKPDSDGNHQFLIGTSETVTTQKDAAGNCERLTIRRLGSGWYFENNMYGESLC